MTTDTTLLEVLVNTDYDDIPMGTRHQVLGEALLYLEVALSTNSLPGIEGVRVVPNMCCWSSSKKDDSIHACLGGLWYMTTTQRVLTPPWPLRNNILRYLEAVTIDNDIDILAGLPGGSIPVNESSNFITPEGVRDRLHSMMGLLPIMRDSYRHATDRWGVELPIEVADNDES